MISATVPVADLSQRVIRRSQRAIVAMTERILEPVSLGGLGSG